jgi:hypothetical protein
VPKITGPDVVEVVALARSIAPPSVEDPTGPIGPFGMRARLHECQARRRGAVLGSHHMSVVETGQQGQKSVAG